MGTLPPDKLLISVRKAAELLDVSVDTVYALVNNRTLPHVKLGKNPKRGDIRIDYQALRTFIAEQMEGGGGVADVASHVASYNVSGRK